ncbi:hypothetical protein CI109_100927 [Kwoniella shandongensis]|uniref:Uncharacterized protein n=1 Tax=Kwoniella shandongensis TaxID=1734106 RepID=A0A5M6C5E9_9TREE|nr:uncharacterized protein CI109_001393 [Kwoniella shandongensis]KAA5529991.1 hypothetical protein CI109_001393 [Kwoniella shandongensis]
MPIALNNMMSATAGPSTSPTTQKISKAAFFRARSPPIVSPTTNDDYENDLSGRFDLSTRLGPASNPFGGGAREVMMDTTDPTVNGSGARNYSPDDDQPFHHNLNVPLRNSYYEASPATDGHGPILDRIHHPTQSHNQNQNPTTPVRRNPTLVSQRTNSISHNHSTQSESTHTQHDMNTWEESAGDSPTKESTIMGIAEGSDEMLMTLLAGQAAVDCESLPVGGWEEVESWKKELTLLENRLESLQSRHQREIKILTAARTLQKLNNSNKRMSKQTMESLEQSEKRVEAAEKEVLILRDREAQLRRRLMEHWSGSMAWEVRRLERVSGETQAKYNKQSRKMNAFAAREADLQRQTEEKATRVAELEEMVIEMGRRERAIEEEARELDERRLELEKEKQGWLGEKEDYERERQGIVAERRTWDQGRIQWDEEKRRWQQEKDALMNDRQRVIESGQMSDKDRAVMDSTRAALGQILGRKTGTVGETEVISALEEVKGLVQRREREVSNLRDEMREVNMGLEEEVRRVSEDRNSWKARAEKGEAGKKEEWAVLEKRLRNQQDQINDLSLRNESLSTSLNAAQTAVTSLSSESSSSTKTLQAQVKGLTSELDSIASQFTSIWSLLPPPSRREQADLVDPRTGASNPDFASPSRSVDFSALQALYTPHEEQVGGINEMLSRIKGLIDDGKMMVERVVRMGKERELLKQNAAKAKMLVEASTHSLETYQQQVAVLEDRLAKSGSSESHFLEELNSLQSALDNATATKRTLESQLLAQQETCNRLSEANDALSARALELAQVAEDEKRALQNKVEEMKGTLKGCEDDADEERAKSQAQRIQLLDELNSLQAEVGDLRKQLRARV